MRADATVKAKDRIARAKRAADDAASEVALAKDAYRWQQLARRRVNDIMTVVNSRLGGEDIPRDVARPYVKALLFALVWEQDGNRRIAARFTANSFPDFPLEELADLAANSYAMSSQDVARLLGVSLEERQRLGLAMIGACDLTDEEYSAFLKDEDKRRRADRKRRNRTRNLDDRRADELANRDALEALAKSEGKSVRTIRRWIAEGKIAGVSFSRPHGNRYRGDATLPSPNSAAGQRPSRPRKARVAADPTVEKKKPAATSASRDRVKYKNDTTPAYTAASEFERAVGSFRATLDQISRPLTTAAASLVSLKIGAPAGRLDAAPRASKRRAVR